MPEDRKPKRILEVVSTDVCGPLNPQTHDYKRYFVTFIDHYSHFAIGHLIEKKSEVTDLFIQYEAMVTAKFGCSIEKLRCDNGRNTQIQDSNLFALKEEFKWNLQCLEIQNKME